MGLIIGFHIIVSHHSMTIRLSGEEKSSSSSIPQKLVGSPHGRSRCERDIVIGPPFLELQHHTCNCKIRPRKACNYPNLRSFAIGWVSYDQVGVLYPEKLGNRSEARASDLRSYPGLWWKRIKLRLYEGKESEYSPRTCSIGKPAGGTLCPHL